MIPYLISVVALKSIGTHSATTDRPLLHGGVKHAWCGLSRTDSASGAILTATNSNTAAPTDSSEPPSSFRHL
jgi:hypothetical protein